MKTPQYTEKRFLIIKHNRQDIKLYEHVGRGELERLASEGGSIIWDYMGLYRLICNSQLKNNLRCMRKMGLHEATALPVKMAKILLEE